MTAPGGPSADRLSLIDEAQANPAFLDPGNLALADEESLAITRRKRGGTKAVFLDIDGGALERDIPHHAAHDRTADET